MGRRPKPYHLSYVTSKHGACPVLDAQAKTKRWADLPSAELAAKQLLGQPAPNNQGTITSVAVWDRRSPDQLVSFHTIAPVGVPH